MNFLNLLFWSGFTPEQILLGQQNEHLRVRDLAQQHKHLEAQGLAFDLWYQKKERLTKGSLYFHYICKVAPQFGCFIP